MILGLLNFLYDFLNCKISVSKLCSAFYFPLLRGLLFPYQCCIFPVYSFCCLLTECLEWCLDCCWPEEAPGHNKGAAIGMCHSGSRVFALEMFRKRRILFQLVGPEFCKTTIVLDHWWLACNKPKTSNCTGKGITVLVFHFWLLQNELSILLLFWCLSFFPSVKYLLSSSTWNSFRFHCFSHTWCFNSNLTFSSALLLFLLLLIF